MTFSYSVRMELIIVSERPISVYIQRISSLYKNNIFK